MCTEDFLCAAPSQAPYTHCLITARETVMVITPISQTTTLELCSLHPAAGLWVHGLHLQATLSLGGL